MPCHCKVCHNLAPELEHQQNGLISAFHAFEVDVNNGGYSAPEPIVPIKVDECDVQLKSAKG